MVKRNQEILNRINALIDMIIIIVSYIFSAWFYLNVLENDSSNMAALSTRGILIATIAAVILILLFAISGFYSTTRVRRLAWKLGVIATATTGLVLIWSFMLFFFRLEDFSRGVLFLFYGLTVLLLSGKYAIMSWLLQSMRASGINLKHQVVIGGGELALQYQRDVEGERSLGIVVERILKITDDLSGILSDPTIDEAVIALEPEEYEKIRNVIGICEKNGVKYSILPFYSDLLPSHPVFESVGKSKLFSMRSNRLENIGWSIVKRGFDMFASGVGLIVLSPLLLALAIGVKLSSPGPILFKQKRVGYRKHEFNMLKFRSMRVNDKENTAWSTTVDDRRTKFGSFIRKFSLDELPQLWNVLVGDMSLVGPRPELPVFVEQFKESIPLYMVKHQVKPGITGWAQVNGYRGDTSIEKRIEYDLWYIDNWSVGLDLKILFKTVFGGMMNTEKAVTGPLKDVIIVVASHKPYWMPEDPMYLPIQVGASGKDSLGFQRDDEGENISDRNSNYCELTGLFWAWKNTSSDYLGLAHYRRHFGRRAVMSREQVSRLLDKCDVLLPKPRHYWIETNYSQYAHAHHQADLDVTRSIISELYPDFISSFDLCMKRTWGHKFNMFIMKRDLVDSYCSWLFSILFELERRLDISSYSSNDKRVFGFVAERLLDVWIEKKRIPYREIPYRFLEKQNWLVKGMNFIRRKMAGKSQ